VTTRHEPVKSWNPVKRLSHCQCDKLTGGHQAGWFERLLMLLIPHFDIIKSVDIRSGAPKMVTVYLRRFYLFRSKWFGLNFGDVYLHHIVRSDDDPDPHDHPWGFLGFILKGGYLDQSYTWEPATLSHEQNVSIGGSFFNPVVVAGEPRFVATPGRRVGPSWEKVRPLTFIRRAATHIHRVIVPTGETAWTLIFTTGYCRDWNFITENGPVMWRRYLGIPDGIDVGE
jgi:hypothetical protein